MTHADLLQMYDDLPDEEKQLFEERFAACRQADEDRAYQAYVCEKISQSLAVPESEYLTADESKSAGMELRNALRRERKLAS